MRILSLDLRGSEGKLITFSVWNGIAAPQGHIKIILKVTLPPERGMMGASKYNRKDVKWDGGNIRKPILDFLFRSINEEKDIQEAMNLVKALFI